MFPATLLPNVQRVQLLLSGVHAPKITGSVHETSKLAGVVSFAGVRASLSISVLDLQAIRLREARSTFQAITST
eukprot:16035-Heterococcus_DN1.PRE.3